MLPSDPDYVPAATDARIRELPAYKQLLTLNTDPYAAHSRNQGLIELLEEAIR